MLNPDFSPQAFIPRLLLLLIALPVHELAHALVAYWLGDVTSRDMGRLSLNPLDHLEPIGAILILLNGFGWAKPVPVNPYSLYRSRSAATGFALVALAGPVSNILLAILTAIPIRLRLIPPGFVEELVFTFCLLNIALAVFNLIPIPPLDGSRVAVAVLPREWGEYILQMEPWGIFIVIGLALFGIVGILMAPPMNFLSHLILGY